MSNRKKRTPAAKARTSEQQFQFIPEYSNPGMLKMLPTSKLTSGLPYQRRVDEKNVERLIREWDDRLLEPLVVSFREEKYNLADGQNRCSALRKMNGGKDVMVLCRVFYGLSYEEEAELYYRLNMGTRPLTTSQSTLALMESGTNAEINDISHILCSEGFLWALDTRTVRDHSITATRAVINAYRMLGRDAFRRMFRLMEETWQGEPDSITATMISGMALFVKKFETEFSDDTFQRHFSVIDPVEIIRRSKVDFSTSNVGLRCARVLLEKYNAGLRRSGKIRGSLQ